MGGLNYRIRITTLTEINSPGGNADRCKLTLYINHGDSLVLPRINGPLSAGLGFCAGTHDGVAFSSSRQLNVYETTYLFPCEGKFNLSCYDPNRNAGIINIPNSVNYPMYFESEIIVPLANYSCLQTSPDLDLNDIILSNQPNQKFYPIVYNSKGDSLVYSLVPCQYTAGQNIPGYSFASFSINPNTGEVKSNNSIIGQYDLCAKIKIYRNTEYIGSINYDHSIRIISTTYSPAFSAFASNLTPVNSIFQIGSSQTLTLSGTTQYGNDIYTLYSELPSSVTTFSSSFSSYTISVTYSLALARKQPYKLYLNSRNPVAPGGGKDTLIRIQMTGSPTNTCSLMGITTTTCDVSVKENHLQQYLFSIYPSITSDKLYIKGEQPKKLMIIDITGRLIETILINDAIDVENFIAGVYILWVTDPYNQNHYYKFVKR